MTGLTVLLRRLALLLLLGVLTLAAVTARTLAEGQRQMELSEEAFDAGRLREAVLHARRAAMQFAPGAPHVTAAYERLAAVAVGAEARGDRELAREAWAATRAAALETEHVWVSHAEELARANRNLERLRAAMAPEGAAKDPPAAAPEPEVVRRADPRWVVLLTVGFALTAIGLGLFASRGVTADGRLAARTARWAFVISVIGVACWTIAVIQA